MSTVPYAFRSMTKEEHVKENIKRMLNFFPTLFWYMPANNGFGQSGIPDFMGVYAGFAFAIETKFGRGKSTPFQVQQQLKLETAGARVWVVNEKDILTVEQEFIEWIATCVAKRELAK